MMSFCKRSVHSLLSLSNMTTTNTLTSSQDSSGGHMLNIPSPASGGLTIFTVSDDIPRPSNVIEWSSFNSTIGATLSSTKGDPGGIGFIDDVGGSVNGLMSCTESLGFESSDERRVVDKTENNVGNGKKIVGRSKKVEKKEVKKFPPPLSTLRNDGKPNFFLLPVRKDGKLELTEVKIHRPEILRASRQDGRLRLHLVHDENDADNDTTSEEEENVQEKKVEEERVDDGWRLPASSGGGECFRRCHESMLGHGHHHHHHHNLHGWRQHCVTIR